MVGEVFRIAFEKRDTYDLDRATARPWLYGIATNLLAKHRRREARRIRARRAWSPSAAPAPSDPADRSPRASTPPSCGRASPTP